MIRFHTLSGRKGRAKLCIIIRDCMVGQRARATRATRNGRGDANMADLGEVTLYREPAGYTYDPPLDTRTNGSLFHRGHQIAVITVAYGASVTIIPYGAGATAFRSGNGKTTTWDRFTDTMNDWIAEYERLSANSG